MKFKIFFKSLRLSSNDKNAFTIIELLVVIALMGILASLSVPSLIRWIYNERINSYIKELQEFIPLTIREARRWGGTCTITPNLSIGYGQESNGLNVNCIGIKSVKNNKTGPIISKIYFKKYLGI